MAVKIRRDRIRNDGIRVMVASIIEKVVEIKLK